MVPLVCEASDNRLIESVTIPASPKSLNFSLPLLSSIRLPGLRSRWITRSPWAYSRACASCCTKGARKPHVKTFSGRFARKVWRFEPSTYSIEKKTGSSGRSWRSCTRIILGWESLRVRSVSCRKPSMPAGSKQICGGRNLSATASRSSLSSASQTTAIPPCPSTFLSKYRPAPTVCPQVRPPTGPFSVPGPGSALISLGVAHGDYKVSHILQGWQPCFGSIQVTLRPARVCKYYVRIENRPTNILSE
jgi:hypothetical protein